MPNLKIVIKMCYKVVLADPAETGLLLEQRFDYIFMTGRRSTGLVVAAAAARHLTPITLQMGGKCPVYVHTDSPIERVVKRLIVNKLNNLGQICLVPDYVLCTPETRDLIVPLFPKIIKEMYGENPQKSKDLGRILGKDNMK
jgi:acyl-CoA reductase-like NAD-dependent aldehyde dehydrogenase